MHIRRFEAASLAEAIEQVKRELGPDALVLSTKTLRSAGLLFGMLGRPRVEVMAAAERSSGTSSEPRVRATSPDSSFGELRLSRALLDPVEAELRALRRELTALTEATAGRDDASGERAELRRLVRDLALERASSAGGADLLRGAPGLGEWGGALLAARVAPSHVRELCDELSAQSAELTSRDAWRAALVRRLERRIRMPRADLDARVTFLVGAPGVGKTTTLAKLAARTSEERPVVVSTDSYRLGAEEQLRTIASLLHAPFAVAGSPEELAKRVREHAGRNVWIDTTGRSRSDRDGIAELARMRSALGERSSVRLVISATTRECDVRAEVRRFQLLAPDALIAAKCDESACVGELANLMLDSALPPLMWCGVGQRVPEDLALPDPELLADQLLEVAA